MVKIYLKDRLVSRKSSWVATCPSETPVADRRMRKMDTWENRQYLPQGRMKSSCSLNANSSPSTRTPFLIQVYIFQIHTGHFHLKLEMQMANIAVFPSKGRYKHSICPQRPGWPNHLRSWCGNHMLRMTEKEGKFWVHWTTCPDI